MAIFELLEDIKLNLLHCVESLSTHTLQKILRHHPPYDITSEEGSTLSFLLNVDYLRNLWSRMMDSEQRVMISFLTHSNNYYLSLSTIHDGAGIPIGEVLVGLTLLRQRGLIYTHRRYFGEAAFFLPTDLREKFLLFFVSQHNEFIQTMDEPRFQPSAFYEDLWKMLQHIQFSPLQLTQKGSIHKRQLIRIESQLKDSTVAMNRLPIQFEGSSQYSKRLALYLDFAIYYDLIAECEDQLIISEDAVKSWLGHSEEERIHDLWHYFRNRLSPFYPVEQQLLMDWLYLQPLGMWMKWQGYLEFLQQLSYDPSPYQHVISIDIIHTLQSLGLICLTEAEGIWWIGRPFAIEESVTQAYIQSNLQILLPVMMPALIRWQIGEFADLIQRDQMVTYEINKSSIERALEIGWNEERILSILASITATVPDNVHMMVHNWTMQYSKLQFLDVTVLECHDESLLMELLNQPLFAPFIVQPLSSRHLIVKRGRITEFREALEQAGYTAMKRIVTFAEEESKKIHAASPILKTTMHTAPKVENVYPDWEETFPGIRSIPKSWVNTFRSYHPSSMIDLLKRAQQNHLQLSLRLTDETEVVRISPIEINHIGGDTMLRFVRPRGEPDPRDEWVALKEIKEMAVHLPYS